uniref:Pectinesterase inhibitor domain-containing protein n=1 Tax=Leersia perrieri TaxID=77586 RepID=A0A0D9V4N7_9ORYZ
MSRHITALILVAVVLAASSAVDARVAHPGQYHVVIRTAGEPGRRLIGNDAICQEVHYKTLCSTLTTLPGVMTPKQLLDAALKVAATKAGVAEARLQAIKLPGGGKKDTSGMSSTLDTCKTSYASLVDALQKARKTLSGGGSHDDLMTDLSAAGTFSTDCADAFDEFPDLTPPIPGAQRHVSRLVSNCLDLAATMKGN